MLKMSYIENNQAQDDSDEDIYKDISEFNFEDELAKLEGSKETYKQETNYLSENVRVLTQENKELKKLNEVLKKNLSTLLKTAQAEVQRKDSMIEELRSKLQSVTFRRCKKSTSDKLCSTEDLIINTSVKEEYEKQRSDSERKRSKSYENWAGSDSEWKCIQEEDKKTNLKPGKINLNCDEKKSDYYWETTQSPHFQNSESNSNTHSGKHKERRSTKHEDSSSHRKPFRENLFLYHSYDKKRNTRSADNRFLSRRRYSRERRHDGISESCERRKKSRRSDERTSRRGSEERSRSLWSKKSLLEKSKSRFSLDNDLVGRKKEVLKEVGDGVESKKRTESCEKKKNVEDNVVGSGKHKQNKVKGITLNAGTNCKGNSLESFNKKSPLDSLYNDMVASRSLNHFSNSKGGVNNSESDFEEGELFTIGNGPQKTNQGEEDWTLSFKNERQCEKKPMTLYSRRMMQKFSLELKKKQLKRNEQETREKKKSEHFAERSSVEKTIETEKEPGELTDDENVIESSKEFKELTKMAALGSEIIKKPATESRQEPRAAIDLTKVEPFPKDSQKELEKLISFKEESTTCKEIESNKGTCDVIEFSPFKNNYKLIEISPIKTKQSGNILDFYTNKLLLSNRPEYTKALYPSEKKAEIEKTEVGKGSDTFEESSRENSSENNLGIELKVVIPSVRNSDESEKTDEISTTKEKESQSNDEKEILKVEENKLKAPEREVSFRKGKRRSSLKKETEKPLTGERTRKRKRKFNDEAETKSRPKKLKVEESEPSRKDIQNIQNSKSESESQHVQEVEMKFLQELDNRVHEDTSPCKVFKPFAEPEAPEIPVDIAKGKCSATDFKMTATMSVTGVVRLETPNKCIGKLKNLMFNEQMIFNILDSKNNSQFSPLIGSKPIEMTPRRMLKNDLMLTDSEDDSVNNRNGGAEGVTEMEGEEEEEEEEECLSRSEYTGSDSGASDFVDLL